MLKNTPKSKSACDNYVGARGCLRVDHPTMPEEPPIWCPVVVIKAWPAYGRLDFLVEPIGGYGTRRCSSRKVWFADERLNLCERRPTDE